MSQICVISIYVPNLKEAIDFYTSALGFTKSEEYGPTIISLTNGDLPLILEESSEAKTNSISHVSGVVLALETTDIYQTVAHLKKNGVTFLIDEPTTCPPGKFIRFADPFGNVLEYIQFE